MTVLYEELELGRAFRSVPQCLEPWGSCGWARGAGGAQSRGSSGAGAPAADTSLEKDEAGILLLLGVFVGSHLHFPALGSQGTPGRASDLGALPGDGAHRVQASPLAQGGCKGF